jgi:hypothetical protein
MVNMLFITVVYRKTVTTAIRLKKKKKNRTFRNHFHQICFRILHSFHTYLYTILGILLFASSFYISSRNYITVFPLLLLLGEKGKRERMSLNTHDAGWPSLLGVVLIHPMLTLSNPMFLPNATKTASDVFRHRSGTGKSYCRTRFDVGSERVSTN